MKKLFRLAVLGAILLPSAASAAFITYDLTGTWTGTLKCNALIQGAKGKLVETPTMKISQIGLDIGVQLDFGVTSIFYGGLANPDGKKPEQKGEAALLRCGTSTVLDINFSDEIARMSASTKPNKVKATFKGVSILSDVSNPPAHATCKWKWTRTDTADPNVPTQCPHSLTTRASSEPRGAARFALDGTWSGTIKCKSLKHGVKTKFTLTPSMRIEQSGLGLGIALDVGTGATNYVGLANPDAKKPLEKGEVAIASCSTDDLVGNDFSFDELGRMTVKAKPGDPKGSFKGTSLFSRPGTLEAEAGTCKWSFKRTVADFPNVGSCEM
jgi:hypothetical protein